MEIKNERYPIPFSPNRFTEARVIETKNNREIQWSFLMEARNAFFFGKKKSSSNRKIRYFCPVHDSSKGICCMAELEPYEENGQYYYRTKTGKMHQHLFPEDFTTRLSTEVIYTPRTFLTFLLERKNKKVDYQDRIVLHENYFDIELPMPEEVQPTNLEEYYLQTRGICLESLIPVSDEETEANYKFCDCFVNKDTTEVFRAGLNPFGKPVLVIAEALSDKDDIVREILNSHRLDNSETICFRDPLTYWDCGIFPSLYYVVHASKNSYVPGKKYIILCDWSISKEINLKQKEIRITEGNVLVPSQIKLMRESLFNRFETYN